jgi:homoserine kinase type II
MASYVQLQDNDIQKIADDYALTVVDFEPIEAGASNSNYVVQSQQGKYVLTIFDDKTKAEATRMGRLLRLLAAYAFPTTRMLSPDQRGLVTMHKGKPVMIKTYIAGQMHQQLDRTMLRQVGAAMARLHQIPVPDFLPDQQPYGAQHLSRFAGRNIDPQYEAWAAKRLAYLAQHIPPGLPRGIIHSDLFCDNVLFAGKKLRAIIDFEDAIYYHKGFDLAMGFVGLCRAGSKLVFDKARSLVRGYQQVRTLEEREKQFLQLFAEYAATAISCWRFWKYRLHTPIPAKADKHLQMVRLAEEIGNIPKASFLNAICG